MGYHGTGFHIVFPQGLRSSSRNSWTLSFAANREVWLDHRNIEPTAEWLKEIFNNIEGSDNFLFVISPDSVVSTYARKEIDHAALNNKRIVPIFYHLVPDKDIPEAVAKFQRIDFMGVDGFDAKLAKLVAPLDNDLE